MSQDPEPLALSGFIAHSSDKRITAAQAPLFTVCLVSAALCDGRASEPAPVSDPCTSWSCRSVEASKPFRRSPAETTRETRYWRRRTVTRTPRVSFCWLTCFLNSSAWGANAVGSASRTYCITSSMDQEEGFLLGSCNFSRSIDSEPVVELAAAEEHTQRVHVAFLRNNV